VEARREACAGRTGVRDRLKGKENDATLPIGEQSSYPASGVDPFQPGGSVGGRRGVLVGDSGRVANRDAGRCRARGTGRTDGHDRAGGASDPRSGRANADNRARGCTNRGANADDGTGRGRRAG
jgi:hypothetical protein